MNIYFGSDAGGWYIGPDGKLHHWEGWGVEKFSELTRALTIIREASHFKTPGLGEQVFKGVMGFAQKELDTHMKGGGVLVIGPTQLSGQTAR